MRLLYWRSEVDAVQPARARRRPDGAGCRLATPSAGTAGRALPRPADGAFVATQLSARRCCAARVAVYATPVSANAPPSVMSRIVNGLRPSSGGASPSSGEGATGGEGPGPGSPCGPRGGETPAAGASPGDGATGTDDGPGPGSPCGPRGGRSSDGRAVAARHSHSPTTSGAVKSFMLRPPT